MQDIRIEQITFTRFIAAITIVIFHFGGEVTPFNSELLKKMFQNADIGVSYFFILSGFIMVLVYSKKGHVRPIEYYQSRFARIYPLYFIALLLCHLAILLKLLSFDFYGLLLNIFMVQAWLPGKALSVNSPGWSLSAEILFYGLFPFLLSFYRKVSFYTVLVITLLLFLVSQLIMYRLLFSAFYKGYPSPSHDLIFYHPLMHLNEFVTGNVTGLFFLKYLSQQTRKNEILIFLVGIILLALLYFPIGLNVHNGFMAIVFVPLIVLISSDNGIISTIFSQRPFVFLGEISYGIYILQAPTFVLSKKILAVIGITNPDLTFYSYLLILTLVSSITYIYIERPLRNLINGIRLTSGTG